MEQVFFIGAGTGDDKMRWRVRARGISKRGKCFDQKVASFLHMEATEEEKKMLPAEFRKIPEEIFPRAFQIQRGRRSAVIHHDLLAMIEGERFAGQTPFFLRSEKDGRGVAQHAILGPGPIEQLLQMLERISPIKPWIEHAVRENVVRRARSPQGAPNAKAAVLPETMNDDGIVARAPLFDPVGEAGSIGVGSPSRAERVHRDRIVAQPLTRRIVEGNDLNLMAAFD